MTVRCNVTTESHPAALVNVCVGVPVAEYVVPYHVKLLQATAVVSPVEVAFRVIVTVSLEAGQVPLLIVHTNVLAPRDNPVTPEVAEPGVVTVALPAITVHTPVPAEGALPPNVAVVKQLIWSNPAFAVVGDA